MLAEPTERFLRELPAVRNAHEASLLLSRYSRGLPTRRAVFDYDVANPGLPGNDHPEPLGVELGWPSDVVRRWVKNSMVLACPLIPPCRKMRRPFTWDLELENLGIRDELLPRPYTVSAQQSLNLIREVGVRSGITVPVHQPGGRTGFVTWVSEDPIGQMQHWADRFASDLFLVAHAFLERIDAMVVIREGDVPHDCPLTARERECLTWVACGKTDGEIAIIIDRSAETARFHVRNAVTKLDAASRSHAVAKAMRRGWLGPIE